jgi:hypothetical protein
MGCECVEGLGKTFRLNGLKFPGSAAYLTIRKKILCFQLRSPTFMERLDNLRRDYLRLAERVRLALQINVGDATRYRQLRTDVLTFLNAAGQVGGRHVVLIRRAHML